MNWTLICVIAILLINILIGVRKGLIKMVFSVAAVVVVTAVTVFASPHINSRSRNRLSRTLPIRPENLFRRVPMHIIHT